MWTYLGKHIDKFNKHCHITLLQVFFIRTLHDIWYYYQFEDMVEAQSGLCPMTRSDSLSGTCAITQDPALKKTPYLLS